MLIFKTLLVLLTVLAFALRVAKDWYGFFVVNTFIFLALSGYMIYLGEYLLLGTLMLMATYHIGSFIRLLKKRNKKLKKLKDRW